MKLADSTSAQLHPANHTRSQRYSQQQREIMKQNRITADLFRKRQIFRKLCRRTNTLRGGVIEQIKERLRVDHQRGNG
jgi:hypothetical protein